MRHKIVIALSTTLLVTPFIAAADAASASISGLNPGNTVPVGTEVYFTIATNNFSGQPNYSVSDSYSGGSVSNSNINTGGVFVWVPGSGDAGNHTLTFTVTDGSGNSATVGQTITVNGPPSVHITSLSPGNSVNAGTNITFTASANGFSNPSFSVNDTFGASSLVSTNISSSGAFSWTPNGSDVGSHTINVHVTDTAGNNVTASQQITVNATSTSSTSSSSATSSSATLVLTAAMPSNSVAPGTTVSFSSLAYGFSSPTFAVADSFSGSSITGAVINASGQFSWIPKTTDAGTHIITIGARDSHGGAASSTVQITVSGTPVTPQPTSVTTVTPSTTSAPAYSFVSYLHPGVTSPEVKALQLILIAQGSLSGNATGYYGSLTEAAVIKFQNAHGISPLGVVGPATRAVLNQLSGSGTTSTGSATIQSLTAQIAALQAQIAPLQAQLLSLQAQLQTLQGGSSSATTQTTTSTETSNSPYASCTVSASPSTLSSGGNTTLNWTTANTSSATLVGIGPVPMNGSQQVYATTTATYVMSVASPTGLISSCQTIVTVGASTQTSTGTSGSITVYSNTTTDPHPSISGSKTKGGAVYVTVNGVSYTALVADDGTWIATVTNTLLPGTYTVTASNVSGGAALASATLTIVSH